MTVRILVLAVLAVFLPGCATAGISTTDALCAAVGVGGGLGTAKATRNAGWGVLVGAAGGLLCKGLTDAIGMSQPSVAYGQPVYHQPGPVMVPSGAYVPDGYELRQIVAQNNTKGTIFVRTPGGMHRVEPGGSVRFSEYVSTGAGGAFYAVHATAAVRVSGRHGWQWAHAYTSNNGTLTYTAEFRDFMWGGKIVPAYAEERHELVPPSVTNQPPGVGTSGVPAPGPPPPLSK